MSVGPSVLPVNGLPDHGPVSVDLPVPERALAVGAHPDDIEFGCGATLAKWAAAGCQIHHLVLTDGSKGTWDPEADRASLVAVRQQEQREAARLLGGEDVQFLGWPDGELRNTVREQWEVCRCLREVRPDVVLGHDPWRRYRLHPDHRNAGFLLTDSLVAARDPLFFPEQNLAPHRPGRSCCGRPTCPTTSKRPEATRRARSTCSWPTGASTGPRWASTRPIPTDAAILSSAVVGSLRAHGTIAGVELGEAFHLVADI